MKRLRSFVFSSISIVFLVAAVTPARADLALTPAGIADGFTLTEFVGGYFFGTYGPLAQGILPNGNVVTGSAGDGRIYVFHDVDNQKLTDAVSATPYAFTTSNPHYAMATAGGQVYGAQLFGGVYEQFFNDGSHTAITPGPGQPAFPTDFLGMWGAPNGDIIAASNAGLIEINPVAGTFRVINGGLFPDGVTVSPDGKTAYVAISGEIQSYDIATGAFIAAYLAGGGPDGTGIISGGKFNGDVIVNNNDGTLGLLDPVTSVYTTIASGGTRGDFVSPDVSNGTLFISQIESVDRLSCGPGCSIGSTGGGTVPEPSSIVLLGSGLIAAIAVQRRKRRTRA